MTEERSIISSAHKRKQSSNPYLSFGFQQQDIFNSSKFQPEGKKLSQ